MKDERIQIEPIRFRYNPRLEWINAILGVISLAMGTFMKFMSEGIHGAIVVAYILTAISLVSAVSMRRNGYLKIDGDWITRYSMVRGKVNLKDVWDVRKNVYGHYILFTDYGKLEILPRQLSKKALKKLKEELKKYKLELD